MGNTLPTHKHYGVILTKCCTPSIRMVNAMAHSFEILYNYAGVCGNTRAIMSCTDTSTLQSIYTEIAYCNTEMSKLFQEMYEPNETKDPSTCDRERASVP